MNKEQEAISKAIKLKSGKEGYLVVYNKEPLVIGLESETFPLVNFDKISEQLSEWYDKEIPDNLKDILKKENLHSLCAENILNELENWMAPTEDKEIAFRFDYFPNVVYNVRCVQRQYSNWYWLNNACSDGSFNVCSVSDKLGNVYDITWNNFRVVRPTFLIKENQKEILDIINENKDEALTYEELTALCRKQEEYIKELEAPSDTLSCEPAKPDYDELCRQVQSLSYKLELLKQENDALRYSLTRMYIQLEISQAREEIWEEDYYKEHKRAEKLFDEVDKNNKEWLENEIL